MKTKQKSKRAYSRSSSSPSPQTEITRLTRLLSWCFILAIAIITISSDGMGLLKSYPVTAYAVNIIVILIACAKIYTSFKAFADE